VSKEQRSRTANVSVWVHASCGTVVRHRCAAPLCIVKSRIIQLSAKVFVTTNDYFRYGVYTERSNFFFSFFSSLAARVSFFLTVCCHGCKICTPTDFEHLSTGNSLTPSQPKVGDSLSPLHFIIRQIQLVICLHS
jgi:hypothetical protein